MNHMVWTKTKRNHVRVDVEEQGKWRLAGIR